MPLTRRQFLDLTFKRAALGTAGFGILAGGAGLAQAYAPAQLNTHRAGLRGLTRPVRVLLLADLHYGPLIGLGQVRGWIDKALSARADVILLLGDFVDVDLSAQLPHAFLDELGRLSAPLGVWGVWGNHDYSSFGLLSEPNTWPRQRDALTAELAQRRIRILCNEGAMLRPDLFLGGVDDVWGGVPDVPAAVRGALTGAARMVMSHNPDVLADAPPLFDLMLSGHTHGGQVRLPLVGALVVPSRYGQRFAQGWIEGGAAQSPGSKPELAPRGFVSRGLGLTTIPLRNLCPSEIVMLDLHPAG
ncbi:metallophosphoesterase [Deinococcus rubellus]|uniref:Metallophosphoesterase n=1 Tax=Deinococcus rubellus TaxID=1889240 RepID=A0ABY5YMW8_9DEIO|nr:metallophosphoesterase [Deinococcus rubellus]UWX65451.1 metallophosphoesterase [Deinococcus rubellus]